MENKTKADDPVYPLSEESAISTYDDRLCLQVVNNGLTKREYFASLAMQAIISMGTKNGPTRIANDALDAADALINALNKQ